MVERLPRKKLTALGKKTVNQTVFRKERIDIRYALIVELATDKRFENPFNRCNEDPRKYSLLRRTWRLVLSMERITSKLEQD